MVAEAKLMIPVLTETIGGDGVGFAGSWEPRPATAEQVHAELSSDPDTLIAELQTQISARTFALTDEIIRSAFAEMEASIFERITGRLRRELPEMIDALLRERFADDTDY